MSPSTNTYQRGKLQSYKCCDRAGCAIDTAYLWRTSFDPRQSIILPERIEESLVQATSGKMYFERGAIRVQAESRGHSLLLLPVQYSRCLVLSDAVKARSAAGRDRWPAIGGECNDLGTESACRQEPAHRLGCEAPLPGRKDRPPEPLQTKSPSSRGTAPFPRHVPTGHMSIYMIWVSV
jgi:hypothetical protein